MAMRCEPSPESRPGRGPRGYQGRCRRAGGSAAETLRPEVWATAGGEASRWRCVVQLFRQRLIAVRGAVKHSLEPIETSLLVSGRQRRPGIGPARVACRKIE